MSAKQIAITIVAAVAAQVLATLILQKILKNNYQ